MRAAAVLVALLGVANAAVVAVPRDDSYAEVDAKDPYKHSSAKAPYPPKPTDDDCDDEDDSPYPPKPTTTKKGPFPPKPTKGPHHPITKTYTQTKTITISDCPDYVKDCPYKSKPTTTVTYDVYTTVCAEDEEETSSSHPDYPKSSAYPVYPPESTSEAYPVYPTSSYAPYPESSSSPETTSKSPYVVAGAGRVEGGLLAVVAGVAALFL